MVAVLAAVCVTACQKPVSAVTAAQPPPAQSIASAPGSLAADPGLQLYRGLAHLKSAEDKWMALNEQCRGGSGDDPKTIAACDEREKLGADLLAVGFCFSEHPEQMHDDIIPSGWEACGS